MINNSLVYTSNPLFVYQSCVVGTYYHFFENSTNILCRIITFIAADKCFKVDDGKRGNKHSLTR